MENKVTNCVFALYQTDKWHTYQSRVLFYIVTSVLDCANALKAKYGDKLLTDEGYEQLVENKQTSIGDMDWEFDIVCYEIGEMLE